MLDAENKHNWVRERPKGWLTQQRDKREAIMKRWRRFIVPSLPGLGTVRQRFSRLESIRLPGSRPGGWLLAESSDSVKISKNISCQLIEIGLTRVCSMQMRPCLSSFRTGAIVTILTVGISLTYGAPPPRALNLP